MNLKHYVNKSNKHWLTVMQLTWMFT